MKRIFQELKFFIMYSAALLVITALEILVGKII